MFLYNESGKKVRYIINKDNTIGQGLYGSVHRLSANECIKIYKRKNILEIEPEVLKAIRDLCLNNFYEIYSLLYTKEGSFKGYTMKYYDDYDIDILTTTTEYTLDNLYSLRDSIQKMTENNIYIHDMHTGNIILGDSEITVIDADLYTFNRFYDGNVLRIKNLTVLNNLFVEIYMDAIKKYHNEYFNYDTSEIIRQLFNSFSEQTTYKMSKRLIKYKYPIEYLRKNIF